jgi:putative transposase
MPYCNTDGMNVFLRELSAEYPDDYILLAADNAAWHRARAMVVPENIEVFPLLPYTPELNPIERIWKELRKRGFKNEVFATLENVVDRLCDTINSLSRETVKSITGREWLTSVL